MNTPPVEFPCHRFHRGPPATLDGTRGRVVVSELGVRQDWDVAVQTAWHDCHNHSFGPGYSQAQIFDFGSPLLEGVLDQVALMDAAGVEQVLWMPIPTNIDGGALACCGEGAQGVGRTYYMPDRLRDNEEPLDLAALADLAVVRQYYSTSVDWQTAKVWSRLPEHLRRRVLLAVTGINLADPHGIHAVMRLKKEYPGVFHWIGEITVFKEVVDLQNGDYRANLMADAALNKYLRFAARSGMGVTLHCDVSDATTCIRTGEPGSSEHLPQIKRLFAAHPDATIVWAHLGGLGKFSPPSRHHAEDLRAVLEACPNVHIDMSWDVVARHYSPNPALAFNLHAVQRARFDACADERRRARQIRRLAEVIEAFPDRFLMGSDALVSRTPASIASTYGIYANQGQGPGTAMRAGLFDLLSPDTLAKILRGNFTRLYARAQAASLRHEKIDLPRDMDEIQRQALASGRTANNWPV